MSQSEQISPWETPPELWRGFKTANPGWQGNVVALYIALQPAEPMVGVPEVRAFADRGLEGDRFFRDSWKAARRPDKAVSLIEEETLQVAAAELGTENFADKSRRNIITRGVPLVELLGREFTIGNVVMRGIRLFEPCAHLEKVSKLPGIFRALEHRSGLKAAILTDGVIRRGDPIGLRAPARPDNKRTRTQGDMRQGE
ncbi:MAG TPA: MOSC domain-containing protein [Candidatus Binatia bacterium]|nr:MOSC domain-containing protein [Candidatus Binatia bacterium]